MDHNDVGLVQIIFLSKWVMAVGEPAVHLSRVFQGSFCSTEAISGFRRWRSFSIQAWGSQFRETGLSGKTLEPGTCRSGGSWDGMTPPFFSAEVGEVKHPKLFHYGTKTDGRSPAINS